MSTKKSIVHNSPKIKQLFPLGAMWESFHLYMVCDSHMDAVPALPLNTAMIIESSVLAEATLLDMGSAAFESCSCFANVWSSLTKGTPASLVTSLWSAHHLFKFFRTVALWEANMINIINNSESGYFSQSLNVV